MRGDGFTVDGDLPLLDAPVLVGMLTGWIDAGMAGAMAMSRLAEQLDTRRIATFDSDLFIDYRARRPTMELRDGVNTRIVWPEIELRAADEAFGEVVLLLGPEPDRAWHTFAETVTELATRLRVRQAVFFGAYPVAVPHTRPPRLACTSPSPELVAEHGFLRSSLDVPAGAGAVLEHALHDAGIPSIGLWAQVPHYLGAMSYPPAAAALLQALETLTSIHVDTDEIVVQGRELQARLDQLVAGNAEHRAMLEQLEIAYDQLTADDLPDGDDLAAQFERFLREQTD